MLHAKKKFMLFSFKRNKSCFSTIPQIPKDGCTYFEKFFLKTPNMILFDKTQYVAELMMGINPLVHFNRPRRFGKSLMMDALQHFYLKGIDPNDSQKFGRKLFIWGNEGELKKTKIGERWLDFREKRIKSETTYLPIYMDFTNLLVSDAASFQLRLKEAILDNISSASNYLRTQENKKSKEISLLLDEIWESNFSKDSDYFSLLNELKMKTEKFKNIKVVFLIDEYETPIVSLFSNPEDQKLLSEITKLYNAFFQKLKSFQRAPFFEKAIMTGVLSLRNLSIFSGLNSFEDLTFDQNYATAFGFTKNELLTNEQFLILLKDVLVKHGFLVKETSEKEQQQKINEYVKVLFQAYNGFGFSFQNLEENSVISPISLIRHIYSLVQADKKNPCKFENHWSQTGSTRLIGDLVGKNEDPYVFPNLIESMRTEETPIDLLKAAHDYQKQAKIPLDIVLYDTGYFSIKAVDRDETKVKLDWTNEEMREAFYSIYINKLSMKDDFLKRLLNGNHEKTEQKIIEFIQVLQQYFANVLKTSFTLSDGKVRNDAEANITHMLFKNLMVNISAREFEILDRFRLLEPNDRRNEGLLPDIIVYSHNTQEVLILEFLKTK